MTTISAGAAAGLLVALMVMSTTDGHGSEPTAKARDFVHPGDSKGFNPQPDPPRETDPDRTLAKAIQSRT